MASFSALLFVAGYSYPVRQCTYEFTQAVGPRGRVTEKVRMGLVQLTLDVPPDDFLPGWAATLNKPLAGQVVFLAAQGGSALETLGWETGQCVGYREEFVAGDQEAGAYICHLTIAAPKLTLQPGGPLASASAATATGIVLETALLKAEELVGGIVKKVVTPAGELGTEILGIGASTLARAASLTALTAGLVLTPANDPDAPGYKSELDLGKLTQNPTEQDKARLAYLENKREQGALSEAEEEELASLLALVRKVFVGGRTGLPAYYTQQATQHLYQLVPEFRGVELVNANNGVLGEFDGVSLPDKLFIEDKSAENLDRVNPRTGLKAQTPEQWAQKQLVEKTTVRIEALKKAVGTRPTKEGTPTVPSIQEIRNFKSLHFRINADDAPVRQAVDQAVTKLRAAYPDWTFTTQHGT